MRNTAIALVLLLAPSYGQIAVPQPAPAPQNPTAEDPLHRTTPRQTVVNFLRATGEGAEAMAQYLEVSGRPATPGDETRKLAGKLKAVLDSDPSIRLGEISNRPEGALDDGLPPDRERIATIERRQAEVDISLRRVEAAGVGQIWLFSADTLRRVPALYNDLAPPAIEQFLPASLVAPKILGVAVWRWLALLILIPLSFGIAWALTTAALRLVASVARHTPGDLDDRIIPLMNGPLKLFLAVGIFHPGMVSLDIPLLLRQGLGHVELVLAVIAIVWFATRMVDLASAETRAALIRNQRTAAVSMIPLGRRIVKVFAIGLACLVVLDNAGFDLRTILTGLGIGGIAVALAAQKTLENIFGAIALVLDQPVRVGDFCSFGDKVGTVEDIGLRSTRIRTLDRTVVCVPNAQFASMNIENFSPREKVWFHPALALRLDTTAAQTAYVRTRVQELLDQHPKVERGARIRVTGIGQAAINLEVFSYVTTSSYDEFVVIQEELLLRMMQIIEDAGTSIAMPAQAGYLTRSAEEDVERARVVADRARNNGPGGDGA